MDWDYSQDIQNDKEKSRGEIINPRGKDGLLPLGNPEKKPIYRTAYGLDCHVVEVQEFNRDARETSMYESNDHD